jgi:hypothetical protein
VHQSFVGQTHRNALRDPQIPSDAKHKFIIMCLSTLFVESIPVPPEHEKWCVKVSRSELTGKHYVTCRSHQMKKQKFGVTWLDALFVKSVPLPPEHEKYCVDNSRPGRTRMHYVTHKSHLIQKYKFSVTYPSLRLVESIPAHLSMKSNASKFHGPDSPECNTTPADPTGGNNTSSA